MIDKYNATGDMINIVPKFFFWSFIALFVCFTGLLIGIIIWKGG